MIVEMKTGASKEEVDSVVQKAKSFELGVQLNLGTDKTGTTGNTHAHIPLLPLLHALLNAQKCFIWSNHDSFAKTRNSLENVIPTPPS